MFKGSTKRLGRFEVGQLLEIDCAKGSAREKGTDRAAPHEDSEAKDGYARAHLASLVRELQFARSRRALSQRRLSVLLGLTELVVSRWEAGIDVPSTDNFVRWVHRLGYAVGLLDRSRRAATDPPDSPGTEDSEHEITRLVAALRTARLDAGFTQKAVGSELNVSARTLLMWETARRQPRVLHLIAWADVLGCSIVLTER